MIKKGSLPRYFKIKGGPLEKKKRAQKLHKFSYYPQAENFAACAIKGLQKTVENKVVELAGPKNRDMDLTGEI